MSYISSVKQLFEQVGYEGQDSQVTSPFDGRSHFFLVLLRGTGEAAGQDFPLFVQEFFEEFGVFVVDVFNTGFFEAARYS